jgi:hypothetical protein
VLSSLDFQEDFFLAATRWAGITRNTQWTSLSPGPYAKAANGSMRISVINHDTKKSRYSSQVLCGAPARASQQTKTRGAADYPTPRPLSHDWLRPRCGARAAHVRGIFYGRSRGGRLVAR